MRAWLVALVCCTLAAAQPQEAKQHFDQGRLLYDRGRYQEAMDEFTAAKALMAAPAFDYNIGRCLERLQRWGEAADAYERYLPSAGEAEVPELRAHIDSLRDRARQPQVVAAPPPPQKPLYKKAWLWGVVGGAAGAVILGVALGVTLGSRPDPSRPIMDVSF